MSSSTAAGVQRAGAATAGTNLRNLYYARSGFAVLWAVLLILSASTLNPVSIALLVLYPLVDLAAAVVDLRSSGATRARTPLYANLALSLLAAIALAVAVTSGIPSVLRVWGAWAITAGVVQLIVAILRYRLGGQWPMILSGGLSTLAGTGFVLMAAGANASISGIAGYATVGGVFFLSSAIRLHRLAAAAK
ncbi:conserved hypothetical protein [Kribbella flavida DSM 17836]|uniref:Integral membrane protein n=1 Tax=Kribbella flavida (strain DSM 17836 / JCM 10339 / NBRC 14399) TaxID=479435 RepID=D2Q2M4_KRIFD|nr:hypothetical protein [Kribbella flavida]ADB30205.1 conserved hypothetical protein [Kribbella flavida DSM 17836]